MDAMESECSSGVANEDCIPAMVEEVLTSSKTIRKKPKLKEEPLPYPFPLPENYRPDVEVALSSGKMTAETRKAFLSQVAASIFTMKRYPTREEFQRVALDIIKKYPLLESPVPGSTKTGAIVQSLINRFKEFHRPPCDRTKTSSSATPSPKLQPRKKPPIESLMETPPIPPGEDHVLFKRHNQILLAESKKARPNMQVVSAPMEKTYAFRRGDVMTSSAGVKERLEQYPFLQNVDQLYLEMDRILLSTETTHVTVRDSWVKICSPKIMQYSF